jgi:hypothetical protein
MNHDLRGEEMKTIATHESNLPKGWRPTEQDFPDVMHYIGQAAVNIDSGLTTIEEGSPIHKALHRLCHLVSEGYVGWTK